MGVLPLCRFRREKCAQGRAVFRRGIFPVGLDRIPAFAQAFEIGIAVLRDHGRDPLRVSKREAKADRRAIIEDIDGVAVELERFGKAVDQIGQMLKTVFEALAIRRIGKAEAGQVRRHHVIAIGERWNEIAEHVR